MSRIGRLLVAALLCLAFAASASADAWLRLTIAPEHRCAPYDRDDYPYPPDVELRIIDRQGLVSLYTGRRFASRRESDIEHVVALSEAHDSGLCAADAATRQRFAGDVDNLTLAAPDLNRNEKRAKDAGEWLPPRNRCWFTRTVVAVKLKYGLTVDRREYEALAAILSTCSDP